MRKPTGTRINTHMPLVGYEVGEIEPRSKVRPPSLTTTLLTIAAVIIGIAFFLR